MQFDFNLYSNILLLLGIASGFLSLFIISRLDDLVRWFGYTVLSGALWAFFYGLELASVDLVSIQFWLKVEYIAIVLLPITWIVFSLKYTGKEKYLKNKPFLSLILSIPMLTYFLLFTNEWHHLYYLSATLDTSGSFPVIAVERGFWYFVFILYFYFVLFWGNYLLITHSQFADPFFKRQTILLVIATSVPLLCDALSLLGFSLLEPLDITPFAFTISFVAMGLGLIKFRLFDVIPIAKDQLIAAMTDGVMVIDAKDEVIEVNPAMKELIGGEKPPYIGTLISNVLNNQKRLLEVVQHRKHQKVEIAGAFGYKESVYFVEIIPLLGNKGKFRGTLLLFKDITEEKINQGLLENQAAELKKHNELKDRLFSIISHDLKGPVLGAKEILDLSKKGYVTADNFNEILPVISDSMDGVTTLLDNLLSWSRSQLKGETIDKTVFDLYQLVQQQKELMDPIAMLKDIDLRIEMEGAMVVIADKNMIELVIRNLINNAIKFCKSGESIVVSLVDQQDNVKIAVKDTGVGISDINLNRLRNGDVFSTSGSNNETGTGLGLLLVRDYVEKHGSELWVNSQENEWSEFSFVLPKIHAN